MNLTAVLITGLIAGGITFAAGQGGLLTGLITRQRTQNADSPTSDTGGQLQTRTRTVLGTLGDDLAPVGGFLAGKLLSYTILGALLGALGSVVQLSSGGRAWLQIGAGLLIIVFGLAQIGVPGFRRIVIKPPASWLKIVRGRARSQEAMASAMLGFTTILLPCGVTLSVAVLALTSGSAFDGAAIMAVFVIGTSPLFAVLGYAACKAANVWSGRVALAIGLVVIALGLFTLNRGLELAGSQWAASHIAETVGFKAVAAE
ncbi:sulfite exporter TauE/SafE family protein [Rhodococcus marinonascens]|uniref:sulfite exporter TauE/SafE family protein n=1 Tax=Rhodococcus marinonascens TaxID=38311 RepID=UPI0009347F35|nr:sulfite exporter TauE/SafE family protein [Rhodococcus marinonascens]